MRNYALICVSAAMMGAGIAMWWTTPVRPRMLADGPVAVAPTRTPPAPTVTVPTPSQDDHASVTVSDLPGAVESGAAEDLSPDEQINVAVYENVNRSVVNINTKGVSAGSVPHVRGAPRMGLAPAA